MAQFVKNSTNYHGARSKTRVTDRGEGQKGKKKGYEAGNNQNNSWDTKDGWGGRRSESTKNSNDSAWSDISTNSSSWNDGWEVKTRGKKKGWSDSSREEEMNGCRRESKTLWNDIEQDFPPFSATSRAPQRNVWEERQKKFQEVKSMEPSNEDEEQRMIRIALELSKQEVAEEERRKRIEEEYRLQEQLLMNNPNEFVEFLLPEESAGATAGENFSSKTDSAAYTASGDDWCDKEYATASKSNSAPKATSTNNKKHSDNWDDFDAFSHSNSHTNSAHKNSGSWDDYAAIPDQKKYPASKTTSRHKNTSNWDCEDSIVKKNQSGSDYKQREGIWDSGTEDKYSEPFKKGKYAESVGNKTHNSTSAVSKDETQSRITKVVNMFGGWGSSSNSTTNRATNVSSGTISSTKSTAKTDKLHSDKSSNKINCEQTQSNLATLTHGTYQSQEENVVVNSEKELFYDTVEEPEEVTSKIPLSAGSTFCDTPKSPNCNQNDKEELDQIKNFQTSHLTNSRKSHVIHEESSVFQTTNQPESYLLKKQPEQITADRKYCVLNENPLEPNVVASYSKSEKTPVNNVASNQNRSFSDQSICADVSVVTSSFNHSLDLNYSQNNAPLQNSDSFKGEPNSVTNVRPVTLIDPPKPASTFLSTEAIHHPKLDSFQPEFFKSPKLAANFQNTEHIESPKPVSSFQTEYIEPPQPTNSVEPKSNPVFQATESNIMGSESPINAASAIPSFALPPSEATNIPCFPANPMMGSFINPNLMGGMNPFLMQPMLMLSNPFIASQLQAMDMYYRAMGMVATGPQNIFPQQMTGFSAPAFGSPAHNVFENSSTDHPIPDPSTEHKVINLPIYPSNETQWDQEIARPNFGLSVMNSNVVSESSFKPDDDDVDSLLMSFLSKDKPCDSEEVCIKPPVPPPSDTKPISSEIVFPTEVLPQKCNKRENATVSADKILGYSGSSWDSDDRLKGATSSTGASLNTTAFSSSSSWDKNDAAQACSVAETSKGTGWGELDNKSSGRTDLNNWNEDVDGWGNDNFTTKSMGNPTHFDSKKKSANRQPSREPNFSRFRR